jgi:hypothetical protein
MPLTNVNVLVTNPGGVDGMDHTSKGGEIVFAGTLEECQKKLNGWCTLEARVVDLALLKRQALGKLSALELLALGIKKA